jgi:hypothetical protein
MPSSPFEIKFGPVREFFFQYRNHGEIGTMVEQRFLPLLALIIHCSITFLLSILGKSAYAGADLGFLMFRDDDFHNRNDFGKRDR